MKKIILILSTIFAVSIHNANSQDLTPEEQLGKDYAQALEKYLNTFAADIGYNEAGQPSFEYADGYVMPGYPFWIPDANSGIRTNEDFANGVHVGINCISENGTQLKVNGKTRSTNMQVDNQLQSKNIGVNVAPNSDYALNVNGMIYSTDSLKVNSTILAKEIIIQSNITSDVVFEDDYKLMSIEELESFLKENKHLPGFPSMHEVDKQGQNLGEIDDLLLRKIEELHLYILQLKKQIEISNN